MHASETTYEGSPGSYESDTESNQSQTTSEPAPEADASQAAAEPIPTGQRRLQPDKPAEATPTDTFHEPMS